VIHVAIVALAQAVRAGLRVMLSESPDGIISSGDSAALTIDDFSSLDELERLSGDLDVILLARPRPASSDFQSLHALTAQPQNEGRLALLLLVESLPALAELADLPLRAWGVLPFEASAEELHAAVKALAEGLLVGSPNLLAPLISRQERTGRAETPLSGPGRDAGAVEALTERESQVLQLLAQGLANKQIAVALSISEHTVKFHVSSIYAKLRVTSRTEAVRTGVQRGLIVL
jgi:DNA-binding NarL/FixJ family response regulator